MNTDLSFGSKLKKFGEGATINEDELALNLKIQKDKLEALTNRILKPSNSNDMPPPINEAASQPEQEDEVRLLFSISYL